jgi:hypothetical protein
MNMSVSIATMNFLTAEQLSERSGMSVLNGVGLVRPSSFENLCKRKK